MSGALKNMTNIMFLGMVFLNGKVIEKWMLRPKRARLSY
jgi:uncharacterized protein (DUF342 family)